MFCTFLFWLCPGRARKVEKSKSSWWFSGAEPENSKSRKAEKSKSRKVATFPEKSKSSHFSRKVEKWTSSIILGLSVLNFYVVLRFVALVHMVGCSYSICMLGFRICIRLRYFFCSECILWTPPRKVSEMGSVGLGCCLEACCVLDCVGVTKVGTSGVDCSRAPQKLNLIVKELPLTRTRWDKSGTCLPKKNAELHRQRDAQRSRDGNGPSVGRSEFATVYLLFFYIVAGLLCGTVCAFAMWCMQYVQTCVTNFFRGTFFNEACAMPGTWKQRSLGLFVWCISGNR